MSTWFMYASFRQIQGFAPFNFSDRMNNANNFIIEIIPFITLSCNFNIEIHLKLLYAKIKCGGWDYIYKIYLI